MKHRERGDEGEKGKWVLYFTAATVIFLALKVPRQCPLVVPLKVGLRILRFISFIIHKNVM
jgi:hypothetical protein